MRVNIGFSAGTAQSHEKTEPPTPLIMSSRYCVENSLPEAAVAVIVLPVPPSRLPALRSGVPPVHACGLRSPAPYRHNPGREYIFWVFLSRDRGKDGFMRNTGAGFARNAAGRAARAAAAARSSET